MVPYSHATINVDLFLVEICIIFFLSFPQKRNAIITFPYISNSFFSTSFPEVPTRKAAPMLVHVH